MTFYYIGDNNYKSIKNLDIKVLFLLSNDGLEYAVTDFFTQKGYKCKRRTKRTDKNGVFDYLMLKDTEEIYVEVKTIKTGFSNEQIEWMLENPEKTKLIIYVIYKKF